MTFLKKEVKKVDYSLSEKVARAIGAKKNRVGYWRIPAWFDPNWCKRNNGLFVFCENDPPTVTRTCLPAWHKDAKQAKWLLNKVCAINSLFCRIKRTEGGWLITFGFCWPQDSFQLDPKSPVYPLLAEYIKYRKTVRGKNLAKLACQAILIIIKERSEGKIRKILITRDTGAETERSLRLTMPLIWDWLQHPDKREKIRKAAQAALKEQETPIHNITIK